MGLRVTEEDERMGLDLSHHSESAYALAYDYDEGASSMPMHVSSSEKREAFRASSRVTQSAIRSPGPGKSPRGKVPVSAQDVKNK
jgi:hypothetical protein